MVWACSTKIQQGIWMSWIQHLITQASKKNINSENSVKLCSYKEERILTFLTRVNNNFALLCAAENPSFKVSFQEVIFCLRKVQLSPHKFQSIQQRLEKTPALYPINRVEIKTQSVAQGLSSLNWKNDILGQIPDRSFVATTENAAFTGSYTKNPFLFKHNHLTSGGAYVNAKSIPANPITLNIQNGDFLDCDRSQFTTTRKINCDEGIGITRNEYKDGFSLFGFDLSPALCVGGHQEFKRCGNLRLSLEFGQPLETSTTTILYRSMIIYSAFIKPGRFHIRF